jgi:hypothetical protein
MKNSLSKSFTIIILLSISISSCWAIDLPTTGNMHKDFTSLDVEMRAIMRETNHKAATLAITANGYSVFNRAYGFQDKALSQALNPNTRMRISIVQRCLTSILMRHLLDTSKLKLTTKVFELLEAKPYHGMIFDQRIQQITLQNILDHKLGWDALNDGESADQIQKMQGLFGTKQLSMQQINSYMVTQQLQSDPGTSELFSEYGQTLLRAMIAKTTGKPYLDFLTEFAGRYSVTIQASKSAANRDDTEIWYQPEITPKQDSVAISALDLVRLFDKFWINGERRNGNGRVYAYYAITSGTIAILRQRQDGINYALVFNEAGNIDLAQLDKRINNRLDSL